MDAVLFSKMLSDKYVVDLKKLQYKYADDFSEFIKILKTTYYESIPLKDFAGRKLCYLGSATGINLKAVKLLYTAQNKSYGMSAVENEIISTSAIENIDFNRDSVRKIMKGYAPKDEEENRIFGLKKGFDFISNKENKITEENIYKLYAMAIGDFLEEENKLKKGNYYRHDTVYVVSDVVEHSGIDYKKLPDYMNALVEFINDDDNINDLLKAAIIHFYIAYLHPYFDGNGRMARMLHLWFLIQKGYETTLFVPFSSYIEKSRKKYYNAFTLIEDNKKYSDVIDITPFLLYFIQNVYDKIVNEKHSDDTLEKYKTVLETGNITAKEAELWSFVLSAYPGATFTTKQLEKDFGNAAYATIRSFVLKFESLELLTAVKMKNKVFYGVKER